ncbi:MAG: DnaJ domain-containing protein [Candidatus Adiutrix sp.]|jgi:DnaJ-class molecular chaperone|nr:DnaJ domain-containing protein [Candidatus Adiutrix sp.]
MSKTSSYQDLNLREGASVSEIKAAFRHLAKAYHPDAAGRDQADVEKFIKAQSAYQKLMKKAVAHNRTRRAEEAARQPDSAALREAAPAANWRFESRREVGLNVHYRLFVLRPETGGCQVVLPWQAREACPRCLGQGQTLARLGRNNLYRPSTCDKCGGSGTVTRESRLEVKITPEMVGLDKIRLRQAGLYEPKTARRGDLILEIDWVDQLPRRN